MKFELGKSVKTKQGTINPEDKRDYSGWQGRIRKIHEGIAVQVELDSVTLRGIENNLIRIYAKTDQEPHLFTFPNETLEEAEERDTLKETYKAQDELYDRIEKYRSNKPQYQKTVDHWRRLFVRSEQFKAMGELHQQHSGLIINVLSDNLYKYESVAPKDWTPSTLKNICLGTIPKKITAPITVFEIWMDVQEKFFDFLDQKDFLATKELQITTNEIRAQFLIEAKKEENWEEQKKMMMAAFAAGIDANNPQEMMKFRNQYQKEKRSTPLKKVKVGRNDKVNVRYKDGTIKKDVKFKKVEKDFRGGKCVLV